MADVPPAVVTVTSTVPTLPAGLTAVICVSELTVNELATVEPNWMPVAPMKFVPVIVTDVPPLVGPALGPINVIVGAALYVN